MFIRIVQVVLAPVLLGALLNQYCNGLVQLVSPLMPFIAVATVAVLCGNAIAQNASAILSSGVQVVLSVGCLHACGFFFGYVLSRILGIDISSARTISIEVGMQVTDVEVSYPYLILHTDDLKVVMPFQFPTKSVLFTSLTEFPINSELCVGRSPCNQAFR